MTIHFLWLFVGAMAGCGVGIAVCIAVLYWRPQRPPSMADAMLEAYRVGKEHGARLTAGDEPSLRAFRRRALKLVGR